MLQLDAEAAQGALVESQITPRHHRMRGNQQRIAGRSGRAKVDHPVDGDAIGNKTGDVGGEIGARGGRNVSELSRQGAKRPKMGNLVKGFAQEGFEPVWPPI